MVAPTPSGYSAEVRIELLAGTEHFFPAQIGSDQIFFDSDIILPGTEGDLTLSVDGHDRRWRVRWAVSSTPCRRVDAEFRELEYTGVPGETTHENRAAGVRRFNGL